MVTVFGAALAAGCQAYKSPANLPTVPMRIGSAQYTVEVAATDATREHGLMQRDAMPANWGMIFVFAEDTADGFWMHNTRIPLDIVFVEVGGRVVGVRTMKPYDETPVKPDYPYRWAIELNKGQIEKSGIKEGDRVEIPPEAKTAKD